MHKFKVIFLLYLVASTQALNIPEAPVSSNSQNSGSHRLHKRDVEEIHSIDVQKVKEQLTQAYEEIRPLLDELVADIAPSIHEKISLTYLPAIRSFREDVMPFFNAKVYPQLQKYVKFGLGIAEKLIEKTYTAYKLSNSTHLAVVSISDLIDEVFNEVKPIVEMGKYLSARMMKNGHYRGKRDVSEISENSIEGNVEVHVIDIQETKEKLTKAYLAVKPILENLVSEIAPSVYEKFTLIYLPKLKEIISNISPFFQSKISPQVQKYTQFARGVAEKLVEKAYRSYHLSNSTHINIVSISDIIEEVYTEMKPVLDLAKYLSMRMTMSKAHYRGKRDLSEESEPTLVRHKRQVPDLLFTVISPMVEDFIQYLGSMFARGSNSIISKVLVPLIQEVLQDPESMFDVKSLIVLAEAAFSPLFMALMQTQSWDTPEGTVVKVPRELYEKGKAQLRLESRAIVRKLMEKYMRKTIGYLIAASSDVNDLFDQMMFEKYEGAEVLKDQYFAFMKKHRGLFKESSDTHVYYYAVNEIRRDFSNMAISASKVLVQFLRRNPDHWLNTIFGENNSFLQNLALGTPIYAKPAPTKKYATPVHKYVKSG